MGNDVVQAQYEQLESIATRFGQGAESNTEMSNRLRQCAEKLIHGDWLGQGAEAFSAEMNGEVFPALQRLTAALAEARSVTLEVEEIIKQAEEEAAAPFRGGHYSGVLYASLGPIIAAAPARVVAAPPPPQDAYVIKKEDLQQYYGKLNGVGKFKGECPAIAQIHFDKKKFGPPIGRVGEWRAGVSLMEHPNLEYGTVIATFDNNERYPRGKNKHVAIFLEYTRNADGKIEGIKVLDQWNGPPRDNPASERILEFVPEGEVERERRRNEKRFLINKANDMYVVTNPTRRPP